MGDVHPSKEPMPIAVIRLAAVQVILGGELLGSGRHGGHLGAGAQHLLMEIVDLAVLHLEVAPEASAQVARLRALRIRLRCKLWGGRKGAGLGREIFNGIVGHANQATVQGVLFKGITYQQ